MVSIGLVAGLAVFAFSAFAQRGHGGHGGAGGTSEPLSVPSTGTDTAGNKFQGYVFGKIKEVSKDGVVLTKTKSGADETFTLNKKTKFIHDGKESSLESLHTGDDVWVDSDQDKKTGKLIARKVITGVFIMPSY